MSNPNDWKKQYKTFGKSDVIADVRGVVTIGEFTSAADCVAGFSEKLEGIELWEKLHGFSFGFFCLELTATDRHGRDYAGPLFSVS